MKIKLTTSVKELYDNGIICTRSYNCCLSKGLSTVSEIEQWELDGKDFKSIPNGGKKFEFEMHNVLSEMKAHENDPDSEPESVEIPQLSEEELFMQSFVSRRTESREKLLWYIYCSECDKLSVRTQNELLKSVKGLTDVLKVLSKGEKGLSFIHNRKTRNYMEAENLFADYCNSYEDVMQMNPSQVELNLISYSFPFLHDIYDKILVQRYKMQKGYYPVLFLLQELFNDSQDQSLNIIADYYGIGNHTSLSVYELADKYDLTLERIRQILFRSKLPNILTEFLGRDYLGVPAYLSILNVEYITPKSNIYQNILVEEKLNDNFFAFCGLLRLLGKFTILDVNDSQFPVNYDFSAKFDMQETFSHIDSFIKTRRIRDEEVAVSEFIIGLKDDECLLSIIDFLKDVLQFAYKISSNENGVIILERNGLNIPEALYDILKDHGKPMTLEEILDVFNERFPEKDNQNIKKIRANLLRHEKITALGKKSTYALKEWNIYNGTTTDYLLELLGSSSIPLHLDFIVECTLKFFPSTNAKSLYSLMHMQENVLIFEGDYFGLVGKNYSSDYIIDQRKRDSRKNFETRLQEFQSFVETEGYFPMSSGETEHELTLYRWFRNVQNGILDVTPEQMGILNKFCEDNKMLPRTSVEQTCLSMCKLWVFYMKTMKRIPSFGEDSRFYTWYTKYIKNYKVLDDNRDIYIQNAQNEILGE